MTEKVVLPGDQEFFKLNEVCKLANVQPYMLRFWGTEFEQLETTTTDTGQRLYSRPQMGLILEIRRLLFDEGLTIAGARKEIDRLVGSGRLDLGGAPTDAPAPKKPAPKRPAPKKAEAAPAKPAPAVGEPEPPLEPESKPAAEPSPKPAPKAESKPAVAPPPKPAPTPAPKPAAAPASEVDKKPRADVQPLLATLRGVRKELAEIVAQLRK
jgi:DNA-binding transcriptional MerR regulator